MKLNLWFINKMSKSLMPDLSLFEISQSRQGSSCRRMLIFILCLTSAHMVQAACDQILSPGANLAMAVSNAAQGTTICLNAGNYGSVSLTNIIKSSDVTVQSTSGRTAQVGINVSASNHLKFQSLIISGMSISGSTSKNITVAQSQFLSQFVVNTTGFNNNNILIDGNTFDGIDVTSGWYEGRLTITWPGGPGTVPAGVTVTNNHFGNFGCSDGLNIGSYGVVVGPGNIFKDNDQNPPGKSCDPLHVDSIQLYGQSNTVIKGNYFYNNLVCIGAYDGGNAETITNNVFVPTGSTRICIIDLGSISNLNFSHNTVYNSATRIGGLNTNTATTGSITNNIFLQRSWSQPGAGFIGAVSNNLFTSSGMAIGNNYLLGNPSFTGGSFPSTWAGYQLQ